MGDFGALLLMWTSDLDGLNANGFALRYLVVKKTTVIKMHGAMSAQPTTACTMMCCKCHGSSRRRFANFEGDIGVGSWLLNKCSLRWMKGMHSAS